MLGRWPGHFKIPKISPGHIFFRALFEGLIFGEAYIRREVSVSKSARLILGGKYASQNPSGWLNVGRKFLSVICSTFLLKLALRT